MAQYDVTIRVRKLFVVNARDEQHAISMARILAASGGPEEITDHDLEIHVEQVESR